jgi:hypothetical protein
MERRAAPAAQQSGEPGSCRSPWACTRLRGPETVQLERCRKAQLAPGLPISLNLGVKSASKRSLNAAALQSRSPGPRSAPWASDLWFR